MTAWTIDLLAVPGLHSRIALCPCPGQERSLAIDLRQLRDWGAGALVTLMEDHELALLGLTSMAVQVELAGMRWWHLPIRDMDTPDAAFEARWQEAGAELRGLLSRGESIALHCRGGKGRTGTIAARLLVELGTAPAQAILRVREARPGCIETEAQALFVHACRVA
jgi:ADP-ribosyl-[dinitrogen reductase] hydrolase